MSISSGETGSSWRGWRGEVFVVAVLAVGLFSFGVWYARGQAQAPVDNNPIYWLRFALGVGLGHGATAPEAVGLIDDFYKKKVDHLDPALLPSDLKFEAINPFSETHLYMIYATGWLWRIFGIYWSVLAPIFGVLFTLSVVAVYGLCRLAMGRALSVFGALLFAITPGHLSMFPQERDYAKGPFILLTLFLLGLALRRATPWGVRRAALLGAAVGGVLGLGLGWRQDIQVCLVPATVIFVGFLPGVIRETWRERSAALAAMAVVFVVLSWPILDAMRRGGGYPAHDIFNGFSEACNLSEGYAEPGAQLQPLFADHYSAQTIRAHARYAMGAAQPVEYLSQEYNSAGIDLILRYVKVFPFNQLLRGMGSFRSILMSAPLEFFQPGFAVPPLLEGVVEHTLGMWLLLTRLAPWCLLAVLIVVSAGSVRRGLALAFLLLFFCMYPTLQYLPRHVYHLGFLITWSPLFLIAAVIAWRRTGGVPRGLALRRVGTVLGVVGAGLGVLFGAAYAVQRHENTRVIDGMKAIARRPLEVTPMKPEQSGARWTLLSPKGLFPEAFTEEDGAWQFVRRIVAVEFAGPPARIPVLLQYIAPKPTGDYSYMTEVVLGNGAGERRTTFYFPVYSLPDTRVRGAFNPGRSYFAGIALPDAYVPLFRGMSVLNQEPELPLYARLDEAEGSADAALATLGWYLPQGPLGRKLGGGGL